MPAPKEEDPSSVVRVEAAEHTHDGVTFTAVDGTLPTVSGNYYLTSDVTITETWEPANGTNLCLNGHTITANITGSADGGSAIRVNEGVTFGLYDCGEGTLQAASGKKINYGVLSDGGGIFNMYGGTIKGFLFGVQTNLVAADQDQGTASKFGEFNMNGGTITGCTMSGVLVFSGTFNMKGGRITQNTSDDDAYLVGWTEDDEEARLVTAYNVIVDDTQNGIVTSSATKVRAGDGVTLTITPADGYRLKSLSVLDANKKGVEVTDYAFTMPASDVTVSATFEATHHIISFDANGGSGTMENQTVATGESATLNENKSRGLAIRSVVGTPQRTAAAPPIRTRRALRPKTT